MKLSAKLVFLAAALFTKAAIDFRGNKASANGCSDNSCDLVTYGCQTTNEWIDSPAGQLPDPTYIDNVEAQLECYLDVYCDGKWHWNGSGFVYSQTGQWCGGGGSCNAPEI